MPFACESRTPLFAADKGIISGLDQRLFSNIPRYWGSLCVEIVFGTTHTRLNGLDWKTMPATKDNANTNLPLRCSDK